MRSFLSYSLVVVCGIFLVVQSTQVADARPSGPVVDGGGHPWLNWSGFVTDGGPHVTYTVPDDRVLVVTTVIADNCRSFYIQKNTTRVYNPPGNGSLCDTSSAFVQGQAHLVFEGGAEMKFYGSGSGYYYVEAYLARQ